MNAEKKVETASSPTVEATPEKDEPFSAEQLRNAWDAFAAQRKKFQAEYQLLSQEYEIRNGSVLVVHLHNPVQETMLNNIRSELGTFLREKLKNNTIQVIGEMREGEEKKIRYTNREKFEYLVEKNPILKELQDRLGLDTDF